MPAEVLEMFHRSARAEPEPVRELRIELVAFAKQLGADEAACHRVALAAAEALNNAALHAYLDREPGPVHVEAWRDESGDLVVRIGDEGTGMLPHPRSPGMGLGLPLMANMADQLQVAGQPHGAGTLVTLRFALLAAVPAGAV